MGPTDSSLRKIAPQFLTLRSSRTFIVSTVALIVFTDALLYGLIVPVVPAALVDRIGIPAKDAQFWTSTLLALYGLTLFTFSPILGWIADHYPSRKNTLLLGSLLLAGSTGLLCFARTLPVMVIARTFQGMAACVVWIVGLALVIDSVEKDRVGEAMGYTSLGSTSGVALSPMLGGLLYDKTGYYSVFYLAFAVIGVDIILLLMLIEKKTARKYLGDDGQCDHSASQASTPYVANAADTAHEDDEQAPLLGSIETPAATSQSKALSTIVKNLPTPLRFLCFPRVIVNLWSHFIEALLLTSMDAVVPLQTKSSFGWHATAQGLAFFAIFVPTLVSPYVGKLSDRYGRRYFVSSGFALAVPFLLGLGFCTSSTTLHTVLFMVCLTFFGFSITLVATPTLAEFDAAVSSIEVEFPGVFGQSGATAQIYALSNSAFAAGSIFGPLIAGTIRVHFGWLPMSIALAGISAVTSIVSFLWLGGWFRQEHVVKRAEDSRSTS